MSFETPRHSLKSRAVSRYFTISLHITLTLSELVQSCRAKLAVKYEYLNKKKNY